MGILGDYEDGKRLKEIMANRGILIPIVSWGTLSCGNDRASGTIMPLSDSAYALELDVEEVRHRMKNKLNRIIVKGFEKICLDARLTDEKAVEIIPDNPEINVPEIIEEE